MIFLIKLQTFHSQPSIMEFISLFSQFSDSLLNGEKNITQKIPEYWNNL